MTNGNPNNPEYQRVMKAIIPHLPTSFKTILQILKDSGLVAVIRSPDYNLAVPILDDLTKDGQLVAKYNGPTRLFCLACCTSEKGTERRTRTVNKTKSPDFKAEIDAMMKERVKQVKKDELTYEDISEVRRHEENTSFLTPIRPDFYPLVKKLIRKNEEYKNKILVENPDLYDGISGRYRNTKAMAERAIYVRMGKINTLALRDASTGSPAIPDNTTAEEIEYYTLVYNNAKAMLQEVI